MYALSCVGPGPHTNEQTFKVVASESFSGSASALGVQTLPVTNFFVDDGDLLAFAGKGPYYPQNANDATNSDATYQNPSNPTSGTATPPGGPGTVFTVGIYSDTNATNGYISDTFMNQGRTYAIGVDVSPYCMTPPPGLVSWWPGEGNALDILGGGNGALEGGVTFTNGKVGAAFNFDGSSGFVSTSLLITNPQTFSLTLWFRTASTNGGVLISFDSTRTNLTGSEYDRNIYLDDAGALHFGVWNSGAQQINSAAGYNDNNWHQVVGSLSASKGLSLYVDGVLAGNNPAVTNASETYNGYWRFGEDNLSNWPYQPASYYFRGQIDEVAIFNTALSSNNVAAIYAAGSGGMCQPTP